VGGVGGGGDVVAGGGRGGVGVRGEPSGGDGRVALADAGARFRMPT